MANMKLHRALISFVILPCRVKLYMVIGKAVKVPHVQNPAPEEIGKYLQLFIDGMQAIYEKHQVAAGYPHSKLVVM